MKRLIPIVVLLAGSIALAQEKPLTVVVHEEKGIVVKKPADDKWELKKDADGHVYKGAQAIINHRIESLSIEFIVATKADNTKFYDKIEELSDNAKKNFENDKDGKAIPDRKVLRRVHEARKFPGAGGPQAWYADFQITDKGDAKSFFRFWWFADRQNPNNLVQIGIFGTDELLKKYEKEIAIGLATMQTFKVKKK